MTVTYERRITLEGSHNFRDLGGYPAANGRMIQWRKLFRSDGLNRLSTADVKIINELGLRTVFDLRSPVELETDGLSPIYDHGVLHLHTPFFPYRDQHPADRRRLEGEFHDLYLRMLETAQPAIREVFTRLAEDETYPAVYHCAAGKDRTGVLSALILRALGVDDETIIADYALSTEYITPFLEERFNSGDLRERYQHIKPEMLRAEPETMRRVLSMFDEQFGPGQAVVRELGVSDVQIETLRDKLLTEA